MPVRVGHDRMYHTSFIRLAKSVTCALCFTFPRQQKASMEVRTAPSVLTKGTLADAEATRDAFGSRLREAGIELAIASDEQAASSTQAQALPEQWAACLKELAAEVEESSQEVAQAPEHKVDFLCSGGGTGVPLCVLCGGT
eukprot:1161611-Pelagomonas_calceolata.AAC.4